ncbi:MAG: hypothetical protein PHI58_02325 [Candidatus Omnitrophica bacterium]|nr:hypothetical protein [Candidatus Omnitrophota bacterium]
MTVVKNFIKIFRDEGWRIFALAVFASFLWHLFWMSAITVVSRPDSAGHVKFSKVSFLGPLLGKGDMGLQARPKEGSFLEKRYLELDRSSYYPVETTNPATDDFETDTGAYRSRDENMVMLIEDALGADKTEPSYDEE